MGSSTLDVWFCPIFAFDVNLDIHCGNFPTRHLAAWKEVRLELYNGIEFEHLLLII